MTAAQPQPPAPTLGDFERRWLAETVRLQEEHSAPLEDAEAVRIAKRGPHDLEGRIVDRAAVLARAANLAARLRSWQRHARWSLYALVALAIVGGAGTAASVLGDGSRAVNVVWAVASLLGINLASLLLWLASFATASPDGSALGRFWMWLTARLLRDPKAALLPQALAGMMTRNGLLRWWFGAISHGLWLLALGAALASLLALLATQRYGFVWETTILSADTFVWLVGWLGALPAALGFATPDPEMIRNSGATALVDESARRAWSAWLVGCLLVYGILPRLLLGALSMAMWRRGRERLRLDTTLPGYAILRERLMPSVETLGIQDAQPEALPRFHLEPSHSERSLGALLVGLELPPALPWPPPLARARDVGIVNNRAERNRLLEALATTPAERLLITCDAAQSPDRGTLSLITELAAYARHCAVWLSGARDSERLAHWREALAAIDLPAGALFENRDAALSWLEAEDD